VNSQDIHSLAASGHSAAREWAPWSDQ
jgi:hypothetical protein